MAFNFEAGLQRMGESMSKTLGVLTVEEQRAQLEDKKLRLAAELNAAEKEKDRGFTAGESEKQRGFVSGESKLDRESREMTTKMTVGASYHASNTSLRNSDLQRAHDAEQRKLDRENNSPTEVKLAKFLTDPGATDEQKGILSQIIGGKKESYTQLSTDQAKTLLGPGYDPNKTYQRSSSGKVEPIGGAMVNIDNRAEGGFLKKMGEQDAERIGTIQNNTQAVLDTAAKARQATELLKKTYQGPAAGSAEAYFKIMGSLGVPGAADKANASAAAQAIISELMPRMRVPGSGTTSDRDMMIFAASLPNILNLPGGNEMIASYWERVANRSLQVQEIAEKYAKENKALTGTEFAKEISSLRPIFSKAELDEMQALRPTPAAGSTAAKPGSPPARDKAPSFTEEDYRLAPSGTVFTDPMGNVRVKP